MRRLLPLLIPAVLFVGGSASAAGAGWDLQLGCAFEAGVSTCRTSDGPVVVGTETSPGPLGCTRTLTRTEEVVTTTVKRGQSTASGKLLSTTTETFGDVRFAQVCQPVGSAFLVEGTQPGAWTPFFYATGLLPDAELAVSLTAVDGAGNRSAIGRGEAAAHDRSTSDGYFGFGQQVSCAAVTSLVFSVSDGTTTRTTTAHAADAPTCA